MTLVKHQKMRNRRQALWCYAALSGMLGLACKDPTPDLTAAQDGATHPGSDLESIDLAAGSTPQGSPTILIPGGTFQMGTSPDGGGEPDEAPLHRVTLRSFFLEETEVTVRAYRNCVAMQQCKAPLGVGVDPHCNWGQVDKEEHPVNCVDWAQARAYCGWLGRRLPTEEEWEYAARGSRGSTYTWGQEVPSAQLCWRMGGTCRVNLYPKTLFGAPDQQGLADLSGNVWEWTDSPFCVYPDKSICEASVRIVRGGSWSRGRSSNVRAAYRGSFDQRDWYSGLGFRCARTP